MRTSILKSLCIVLAAACTTALPIQTTLAGPEPEVIPTRWQLDVEPGPLRVLSVQSEDQTSSSYFVFTYDVINNSGEDLFFAPWFDLYTDEGDLVRSGRGISRETTEAIIAELGNPLHLSEIGVQGQFLQGEENGRLGVAIWPAEDLDVDDVAIYLMGFSGETRRIVRPDTGEEVTLRKSLMLRHAVPGTLDAFDQTPLERTETRWVLR